MCERVWGKTGGFKGLWKKIIRRGDGEKMSFNDLKKLVVYYSLDGNTRFAAQTLSEATGADLLELVPVKKMTRGGLKFLWGGKQVIMKEKPKLLPLEKNPEDYDVIILGTPVWAGSYAPAIRTFLAENEIKNKKVALYACYGGSAGKSLEKLRKEIPENEFLPEGGFAEPLKNADKGAEQVKEWAEKLSGQAD